MARGAFPNTERVATCDVCGGRAFQGIDSKAHVVECAACGYRFVSPRPTQTEIAAAYSEPHFYDGWIADEAGRRRMWLKRLALVRRHAPGPRLLDVGTGIGTFVALARDKAGWTATGTEISDSAIRHANERYGLDLLHGQLETLDLEDGSFDTITLWHVLEHVPKPRATLRRCRELLADAGLLVVAVPNDSDSAFVPGRLKRWVLRRLFRTVEPQVRYEPLTPGHEIHLSHFSQHVLTRLLESVGFTIVETTVDDHFPTPTWKTDMKVAIYRLLGRLTRVSYGQAMLVFAVKR